jgi:hypothetical protein
MEQPQIWLSIAVVLIALVVIVKLLRYMIRRKQLVQKYGREIGLRILRRTVWQGMSSEQLVDSWGSPADIDHLVYKTKTKETWKYHQTGKNRFKDRVYLEGGVVVGWKD